MIRNQGESGEARCGMRAPRNRWGTLSLPIEKHIKANSVKLVSTFWTRWSLGLVLFKKDVLLRSVYCQGALQWQN